MNLKLGRTINHRHQMLKNLAISIFLYEKVSTTSAKAKAVIPLVDWAINIAKDNNLTSRRQLLAMFLHNKNVVEKLLNDLGPKYKNEKSGFLKIFKNKPRVGDNAPQVIVILKKSKFLQTEIAQTVKTANIQKNDKKTKTTKKVK